MKMTITFILMFIIPAFVYGQEDLTATFKQLYQQEKYDKIIKHKIKNNNDVPAKALYYLGMSYYMKSEDQNAMKYLDMALAKGPVDFDMFYYKGMLLYYGNQYNESLPYFDKAIELLPGEPDFYAGKGEAYYSLNNKDSAIVYFEKAAQFPNCKTRVFLLMGELYQDLKRTEDALAAYQKAYAKLPQSDESYQNCSYNVALFQQLTGKEADAKTTLEKHMAVYPADFHAMAKLIQVYYALSEFDKVPPYKEKLYAAHKAKKLKEGMEKMFCFDQFIWNGKRVMAFELFDEPDEFMFVKHHFYVMEDENKVECQIDSESSIAVRMSDPKNKYVLCLVKDGTHHTYWQYVFNDTYKYSELKSAVLDILNNNVKPNASFIPGTTNH